MADILLVIALVILFFFWNPFGIFGGGIKLRSTANLVTQIREMGQLVTSEYYGEVIASLEESRINYLEEEAIEEKAMGLYDLLYEAMNYLEDFQSLPLEAREARYEEKGAPSGRRKIIQNSVNRRNIIDKLNYHDLLEDLSYEPLYGDILEFTWLNEQPNGSWRKTSRQKEEALMLIYSHAVQNQEVELRETAFMQFYFANKRADLTKKESKKKLAMIGRGWVKAGFDFAKLDNTNFYINEEAGEVHFFGLSASILNSDINPWFIPERGIPGFEILDYNGKVDFKDAKRLKLYCIDKLIAKAHQAAILKSAENNGAEMLRNIFSLLTGEEIKKVFFHHDDIIQFSKAIAEDEYISYQEAVLLDSQLIRERKTIKTLLTSRENSFKNKQLARHRQENIQQVLNTLYSLPFEDLPGKFNKYSKIAFEIARDSIIDKKEMETITKARFLSFQIEEGDSLAGPKDSLSHASDYNNLLKYLIQKGVKTGSSSDTIVSKSAFSDVFLNAHYVLNYETLDGSEIKTTFLTPDVTNDRLLELLYPYHIDDESWIQITSNERLILDSLPLERLDSLSFVEQTTVIYDATPSPHLKILNLNINQLIEPLLLKNTEEKIPLWVSNDLCIIRSRISIKSLDASRAPFLSVEQSKEMEEFYRLLLNKHAEHKKMGPVVRANQWIQNKFENNTSLPDWFSKLKTKLSE